MFEFVKSIFKRSTVDHIQPPNTGHTLDNNSRPPNFPAKESVDTLPPSVTGSQKAFETEQARYLMPNFGLLHAFNLSDYLEMYVEDSLASAIVNATTDLIYSPLEFVSEKDEVNTWLAEWARKVDLDRLAYEVVRDVRLYGFSTSEIIGDGSDLYSSSEVIAIKRLDPRYIFLKRNLWGRLELVRQMPAFIMNASRINTVAGASLSPMLTRDLEPDTVVYCHSLSPFTSYGMSVLQPLRSRLRDRNRLIAAQVNAFEKHSNSVHWLRYRSDGEREEIQSEIDKQVLALKNCTTGVDKNGTRWIISGGTGEYEHELVGLNSVPDAAPLLQILTNDIINSAGFNPETFSGDGKSETTKFSVDYIVTQQRAIMSQLHACLFARLPFIERDCPADSAEDIKVQFVAPDETTLKERLEAEAIKINNVSLKLKMGAIDLDCGAKELGYSQWANEELGRNFANSAQNEVNANDPNSVQRTRASIDAANNGRDGGNNPTGKKEQ